MRRRLYSEDVPLDEVADRHVLAALASREIELVVAVRPFTLGGLPRLLHEAASSGVRVTVWPMLTDRDGRWVSTATAAATTHFVRDVLATSGVRSLLLDLEPPFASVRHLLDRRVPFLAPVGGDPRALRDLSSEVVGGGTTLTAAIAPMVLADGRRRLFQRWLGTPVDDMPFESVTVMAYTSLAEGYSRGLLGRDDARFLLWIAARAARARFGERAGISLGAVGVGALGDEKPYRGPRELEDDVAIARAAGIEDLALFDLRGALARPPLLRWLDALHAEPATTLPRATTRARAIALGLGAMHRFF